jgi:hypothetical protein
MDGETHVTRADAVLPFHEAQRLRLSGDNAGGSRTTDGLHARANPATVEGVPDGGSNPRLVGTGVTLPDAQAGAFGNGFETTRDGIPLAFAEGLERLSQAALEAARSEQRWLERIRAGLSGVLECLDAEPRWGRSLILELDDGGVAECARRVHQALGEVLREGRGEVIVGADLAPPTELIAELVTLAVFSIIQAHLLRGRRTPLVKLAPGLMSFIVTPYLGRGAAKADLAGTPAVSRSRAVVVPIRPDPRTMLALEVIVSTPRLSDCELAAALGINPEGCLRSGLLRPLEQRGLIENASPGRAPREPKAWLLTLYGHRVIEVIADTFAAAHRREAEEEIPGRASGPRVTASEPDPVRIRRRAA